MIIVETGQLEEGANSWVTRAQAIDYAAARGVTLPNDATTDRLVIQAQEFISSHEDNLIGERVSRGQGTAYPRFNLRIQNFDWGDDEIPRLAINCQFAFVLELHQGVDIYNPPPIRTRKKERVEGAIDVEYFGQDHAFKTKRDSRAFVLLSSLLNKRAFYTIQLERR